MKFLKTATAVLFLLLPFTGIAQEAPGQPPPAFCENNPGFDEFDFWVGEWNVYSNDELRLFAGTNSVTKHYRNCLVMEDWTSSAGGGGFSINYYNPVRDEWRQVWVSNGYAIDYSGGLNDSGAMVLEGEIDTYQGKTSARFKGTWTREENGDVIQRFEAHDTESDSWTVWFEGRYVRKESDPNPPSSD